MLIDINRILEMHESAIDRWHRHGIDNPHAGFMHLACRECALNYRLWHEEDLAHAPGLSDTELANRKRQIDKLNQLRNNHVELMDEWIAERLACRVNHGKVATDGLPINTETPGSAIDRLAILGLRIFHLQEKIHHEDSDVMDRRSVAAQREQCCQQRADLAQSLQELVRDLTLGRKRHKTYRQNRIYDASGLDGTAGQRRKAA